MNNNFRYDINGLRAYAVALVVLFHFNVIGFSSGFIGVDIFFVISGFLMTSIILKGIESNTFSFLKFYYSRGVRIIPPLFFLCLTLGIIGWFTLTPQELKEYAKYAITSLNFVSNIQFFKELGYFHAANNERLLLHTWSLSVEWQFYIILPILLYLINKIFKNKNILKIFYVLIFLLSLILCIKLTPTMPTGAFFLLPMRAWEMMSGGLVYLFFTNYKPIPKYQTLIELFGFLLIAISVIAFDETILWPSYNAIIPVLGASLILIASNQKSILTNNFIAQFLGNISYSVYLWHWPLVFYVNYFEKTYDNLWIIVGIGLSVLFGWLSYKYIENPSRKFLGNLTLLKGYSFGLALITVCSILFGLIFIKDGIPDRLPVNIKDMALIAEKRNLKSGDCHNSDITSLPECKMGNGKVGLILIGDSHAESVAKAVQKSMPPNLSLLDLSISGCPTVINIHHTKNPNSTCAKSINHIIKLIDNYPNTPILLVNRSNVLFHPESDLQIKLRHNHGKMPAPDLYIDKPYESYNDEHQQIMKNAYTDTLCKFAQNHTVFVTTPTPEYAVNIAKTAVHRTIFGNENPIIISKKQHMDRSSLTYDAIREASSKCNVKILDTTKYLCDDENCHAEVNNIPIYFDKDHLNLYGADQLIPMYQSIFN